MIHFSEIYLSIFDDHHGEDDHVGGDDEAQPNKDIELDEEAEALYSLYVKNHTAALNDHWERCEDYDSSISKIHRIYLTSICF